MFCPICGQPLKENHEFCPSCGSDVSQLPPSYVDTSIPGQKSVMKGPAGPNSKICLILAIFSMAIVGVGEFTSLMFLTGTLLSPTYGLNTVTIIILTAVIHIVGIVFGILSRVFSGKAGKMEPRNNIEKVGSVLAIIGIASNAMSLGTTFLMAPMYAILESLNFPF
jgi:hypothetical protein